ncbi:MULTISPECIES: PAS domain-containing protein [Halomonadaceae]|uniref:PAS domain-containing protein n=1 Tax=Halomonadaceae TaxID=28256 RepID=UPI0015839AB8|nr:PAS domain-containing protein [Halomonas sp. BMC7]MDI4637141.1 PAS domain-containing protein [Halomonas sp. BMC7]NUJ58308.1 PAS domain-containing protein [Halomonas taeanensis]
MRTWRFSRLLLALVLAMLAGVSLTLLATAYLGAERALQHEAEHAHASDQRMLDSVVEGHFRNIRQYSEKVSQSAALERALMLDDNALLGQALQGLMQDSSSRYIDAMVVEHDGQFQVAPNASLQNLKLPLEALSRSESRMGSWVTVDADIGANAQQKHYSLLRLTLPVVEPLLGEVVGRLHTFVLLNDNFWILNELQSMFGARAIALSHKGTVLDSLESGANALQQLKALKASDDEVLITPAGILREHVLKVGRSGDYRLLTVLPSDSYHALRDLYSANLVYATLMVVALGVIMMLVVNRLTSSALGSLTRYAEQVPDSGAPKPFKDGHFEEVNRVGRAFEEILRRIHERDKYLAGIIEHSPDLIFLKDLDHSYCLVNQQYAKALNTTPQQLLGRPMWEVLDHEIMEYALAMDRHVLLSCEPVKYKQVLTTPSGIRSFLFSKYPIIDDHGAPYLIGGIATDITDLEQIETELDLTKEALAETRAAAIVLDEQQRVLIANSAFAEMSGFPEEEARSAMRLFLMVHPDLVATLDQDKRWEKACQFERRDGELRSVRVTANGVIRDQRRRYVILFREIA